METADKDCYGRKVCIVSHRPFFSLLMSDQALARDGFRCIITGIFDEESLNKNVVLRDMAGLDGANGAIIYTCRILGGSTTQGTDRAGIGEDSAGVNKPRHHQQALSVKPSFFSTVIRTHYTAGAMALLEHFWFSRSAEAFRRSEGVHKVWNLLSLESNLHSKIDHLNLWFERTSQVYHSETRQPRRPTIYAAKPLQVLRVLQEGRGLYPP
jgi:hypothetical protein